MSDPEESAGTGAARERRIVAWLALAAALRVLVHAGAFPFFNQIDEHQHVDSVWRYSRGQLPGAGMATLGEPVVRWSLAFGSFEYLHRGPDVPPAYLRRPGVSPDSPAMERVADRFRAVKNTEFDSPPVYYAVAGAWLRLGEALGLEDRGLLTWLRGLNAVLLALLVVGSHRLLAGAAGGPASLRLGVPVLLAFSPQDWWYGVTSDAGAAAAGALAFAALVRVQGARAPGAAAALVAGLAVAAAFLTKLTNVVYGGAALLVAAGWLAAGGGRRALRATGALLAGAGLPVALWLGRNRGVLGDLFGTARKEAHLQWSPKPVAELLDHPLFHPWGLGSFLGRLTARFWRGELEWHGAVLAHPWMDALYVLATALGLGAAAWALRPGAPDPRSGHRDLGRLALLCVGGAVAVLAGLSLRFDFATWGSPSRDDPFFVHGRLVSGVLLPFACVWVLGLRSLCGELAGERGEGATWQALLGLLVLATLSEAWLQAPAFASPVNAWSALLE